MFSLLQNWIWSSLQFFCYNLCLRTDYCKFISIWSSLVCGYWSDHFNVRTITNDLWKQFPVVNISLNLNISRKISSFFCFSYIGYGSAVCYRCCMNVYMEPIILVISRKPSVLQYYKTCNSYEHLFLKHTQIARWFFELSSELYRRINLILFMEKSKLSIILAPLFLQFISCGFALISATLLNHE